MFSFNKAHNVDQTIPQWIIKTKGQTFYVNHLVSEIGFSSKETPQNPHTKGGLQFKGRLLITEQDSKATAYIT
jgi:hypothetical protein